MPDPAEVPDYNAVVQVLVEMSRRDGISADVRNFAIRSLCALDVLFEGITTQMERVLDHA
jgi:hypothetical protein